MNTVFTSFLLVAVVIELLIGARLIVLGRKTKGLPETLWGWAWVCDALSQGTAPIAGKNAGVAWADALRVGSTGVSSLSLALLAVSIWFVFRPDQRTLRYLVTVVSGLLALSFVAFELFGSVTFPDGEGHQVMRWINRTVAIGLLAWGLSE
ncbi:MAG: hypothetical protein AAF658_11790 [Myxococcota bacterium]